MPPIPSVATPRCPLISVLCPDGGQRGRISRAAPSHANGQPSTRIPKTRFCLHKEGFRGNDGNLPA
jgi:hypothetical protein